MNNIRFLSWNINGVSNIKNVPAALKFVQNHDIVFCQETFELRSRLHPSGFIKFSNFARSTGGRPSGGLTTLISQKFCGNAAVSRIPCSVDWILPLRLVKPKLQPVVLLNLYIPRFSSDFSLGDVALLADYIVSLRQNFPNHALLIGSFVRYYIHYLFLL